nr:HAMP domain-containing histidine kinase [Rhodospirillales bacterium]
KALTRFEQLDGAFDKKYEGTGLGLPLTKELVKAHGGTFLLTSRPGTGTVATVCLPVKPPVNS